MKNFFAVVHHVEAQAFGMTFPDLPGCIAASDEFAGIYRAADEALRLWFEDMPFVEPSSLHDLRAREDVQAELAAGAVLIQIPFTAP